MNEIKFCFINFLHKTYYSYIFSSSSEDSTTLQTPAATGEGCLYKGLTPQEMSKLKQSIAKEDVETFETLVASNPRFVTTLFILLARSVVHVFFLKCLDPSKTEVL